ncbi:NAD(P)-binding protein [Aureobasidium subglaciale]|nr:NAD(P)-binding protein [Aureobasidium subglaciale]
MKIAITGAGGFVGQLLAEHLLLANHEVLLIDIFEPPVPSKASSKSASATCIKADLYSDSASVIPASLDAIFIFHGIMSAGSEADFDLGYRVNLHSTLNLLETLRQKSPGVKVIYASSTAIYGNPLPEWPSEQTLPTPSSSYGTQKTMIEYAINDFTRRGYINGFSLRFPTISVRPGKPTQAASSWMSGIFREPLQGIASTLPCPDEFEAWLCSPRILIENLKHVLTLEKDCLPSHVRQVNLPGITANVKEMLEALEEVGGKDAVGLVRREEPSKEIKDMLDSWPVRFDVSKALGLGFKRDEKFRDAVEDFKKSLEE